MGKQKNTELGYFEAWCRDAVCFQTIAEDGQVDIKEVGTQICTSLGSLKSILHLNSKNPGSLFAAN
jgi:hypothetical protein